MPLAYQYAHQYPRTKDVRSSSQSRSRQLPHPSETAKTEVKYSQQPEHDLVPRIERPLSTSSEPSMEAFLDASDAKTAQDMSRASSRSVSRAYSHKIPSSTTDSSHPPPPPPRPPPPIEAGAEDDSDLPALQVPGNLDGTDTLEPIHEDDPSSFDLVSAPVERGRSAYSLETRSQQLFSRDHLQIIFADPPLLLKFTAFLSTHRPQSVPILIYYLDALKALRAINYSNAIAEALEPINGHEFTSTPSQATVNTVLEQKANNAFDALVKEDLPAYITHLYIQVVSISVSRRVTGTLAPHLREASEGLAEVFCLTDPSRPDNPIVFSSEEFHRTTQYGMSYVLGRNCRFLQGPWTNPLSVKRIREAIESGRDHCEVFLNYRRDGSPFMNLLMCAPLRDSRGTIRYFIGAQVDVSGLVKECTELESLQRLLDQTQNQREGSEEQDEPNEEKKDEFQELSEMLNMGELATVRKHGGRMHREAQDDLDSDSMSMTSHKPRLLLKEHSPDIVKPSSRSIDLRGNGRLGGVYQHYLLVRPYPSLRILFASPSQRVPGILQSPFLNKIGGSDRVRDEFTAALAEGRGVTAKVRWVSKSDEDGRNKWIHCTPLFGSNGQIGVWMVVIVDDEKDPIRRWKQAPPVQPIVAKQRMVRGMRGPGETHGDVSNLNSYWQNALGTHSRGETVSGGNGVNGVDCGSVNGDRPEREGSILGAESLSSLRI